MEMQMGKVRRMMRKAERKVEHMWHRMTNSVEKKLHM